ncbi:MAG: phosphoribulokinase [Clostridia bacterium]|nr:phosphoribulokinase [Clostridia bacterium]
MKELEAVCRAIRERLAVKERVIVAIDGCCAAGKTTLAENLANIFDCNVFHADDFFLRPEQRTPRRLGEVGGNIDYERFRAEVIEPLLIGKPFSYSPYDCSTQSLSAPVTVDPRPLEIVEGSYSTHPYLGKYDDLRIFMKISPALQKERILLRPSFLHRRFFEEWIPMEQAYFAGMEVEKNSDLVIHIKESN